MEVCNLFVVEFGHLKDLVILTEESALKPHNNTQQQDNEAIDHRYRVGEPVEVSESEQRHTGLPSLWQQQQ